MTMSTRTLQGLVLALALAMARAQDPPGPAQDSAAAPRKFEVTSIKRANAKQRQPSLNILPGGRLNTTGTSLRRLMSSAPISRPTMRSTSSPRAVSIITGTSDSRRRRRRTSNPFIPGRFTSSRMSSGPLFRPCSIPSSPDWTVLSSKPSRARDWRSRSAISRSSSITSIFLTAQVSDEFGMLVSSLDGTRQSVGIVIFDFRQMIRDISM